MGTWIAVVQLTSALNVLLLLGLDAIWVRNYRALGSKHSLGLLIFGALLLVENLVALYVFGLDPALSSWFASSANMPDPPGFAMMVLRLLETAALIFLAWITVD